MLLAVGEHNKSRDGAIGLQKRMKLHGSLDFPEPCPGEDRQAQLDERRIEDIELAVQLEFVFGSER